MNEECALFCFSFVSFIIPDTTNFLCTVFFWLAKTIKIKFACNNNVIYDHESDVYDVLLYRHHCTNSARNVTKRYLKKMV